MTWNFSRHLGLGTCCKNGAVGVSGPFQNEWKCLACKRMARMDHVLTIKGPIKFHWFQSSLSGVTPPPRGKRDSTDLWKQRWKQRRVPEHLFWFSYSISLQSTLCHVSLVLSSINSPSLTFFTLKLHFSITFPLWYNRLFLSWSFCSVTPTNYLSNSTGS